MLSLLNKYALSAEGLCQNHWTAEAMNSRNDPNPFDEEEVNPFSVTALCFTSLSLSHRHVADLAAFFPFNLIFVDLFSVTAIGSLFHAYTCIIVYVYWLFWFVALDLRTAGLIILGTDWECGRLVEFLLRNCVAGEYWAWG